MSRLDTDELEQAVTTAYLAGRVTEAMEALQRAQELHARRGDARRASRSAFWLGFLLLGRGELAQGSGWLARARRLLEGQPPDCPEHGYLLLPAAMGQIDAGDHAGAQATAARASALGRRAGEADLVAMGLFLQGRPPSPAARCPRAWPCSTRPWWRPWPASSRPRSRAPSTAG